MEHAWSLYPRKYHLSKKYPVGTWGSAIFEPSTAQLCRSATENNISEDLSSSVLSQLKKYHPSENLKFNNLRIFQSWKLRISMGIIFQISLYLNFTRNTSGCYGLRAWKLSSRSKSSEVLNPVARKGLSRRSAAMYRYLFLSLKQNERKSGLLA